MDRTGHFLGQQRIDAALPGDSAVAGEGSRDDLDVEMRLALRPRAGVPGMARRLIAYHQPRRLQRRRKLGPDAIGNTHQGEVGATIAVSSVTTAGAGAPAPTSQMF